jgi:hypothetical protein
VKKYSFILFIVCFILSGCGAGGNAVKTGQNVDYIGSVEQRVNGSYFVFAWNDTSNAYCTLKPELATQASKYLKAHSLVIITYSGINSGDPDGQSGFGTSGCEHTEKVQVLRLDNISELSVQGDAK